MKKLLVLLCVLSMTTGVLTACGSGADGASTGSNGAAEANVEAASDGAKEEEAPVADTEETSGADMEDAVSSEGAVAKGEGDTFTVGFDAEFPPYGYMDENGEYVGFDLDLAKEVCARNGWEFVAQPIDWDSKDMELDSGAIDCIWNGFTMQGREESYTWSVPYVDNSQMFVVPADAGIASQADLAGKVVGVQKDSSALAALEGDAADLTATFADLQQYGDYNVAFMDLEQGAIDALAIDVGVANYQISSRGDAFVMLEEALASEQYGIGFKLGNEDLKNQVEKTLMEMVDDGTFMEIAEKYADFGLTDSVCLGK